jgi:hypothetical protein
MKIYEKMIDRANVIGKWSVMINPEKYKKNLNVEIKV